MIDINKLNRIKGILSARLGAEIPKFSGGAKFTRYKGTLIIYSNDNISWFWDPEMNNPVDNATIQEFNNYKQEYEIPGDLHNTPNTAVEQSGELMRATQQAINNAEVSEHIKSLSPISPISPNDPIKTSINVSNVVIPEKIEIPLSVLELQKTAGINLLKEKEKEENKANRQENLKKFTVEAAPIVTEAFKGIGNTFGAAQAATDSTTTKVADLIYNQATGIIEKMGPVGKGIGAAMGFAGTVGDIIQGLGGGTDQMTNTDKWMDSSFFSWNIGMLNGFGGKKTDAFAADQDILANVGSSYGGTTEDINNAASKASKKYGLFSSGARRKANRQIDSARVKQNLMGDISDKATDLRLATLSMGELAGLAYSLMTNGGYSLKYTYAAKNGGIIKLNPEIELEWTPPVELNWELPEFKEGGSLDIQEELEWIPEFKDGGKTEESDIQKIEETTQKNVIPEGALHKNKHHMEHAEGLTKKGIPVIDEDGEQLAEIEHSEIIFTLEVTKKLEEYYNIFYSESSSNKEKEQAALDTGKLLVYQILENTEDRTGLIESCKKGGTLSLKKSTDDLIEEVLEWIPTVVVEEFNEESNKKSEKELMKEAIKEVLIELLTK